MNNFVVPFILLDPAIFCHWSLQVPRRKERPGVNRIETANEREGSRCPSGEGGQAATGERARTREKGRYPGGEGDQAPMGANMK